MNCFFFSGLFWGALLILLGISIVLKVVLGIHFPFFRLLIAVAIIYFGIRLLIGAPLCKIDRGQGVFGDARMNSAAGKYDVIFGRGLIDLSDVKIESGTVAKKVSTVFGEAKVKIDPAIPAKIITNSAFAGAKFPDGNLITFGKYTYTTKSFKEGEKHLLVEADVVFGSLEIINK